MSALAFPAVWNMRDLLAADGVQTVIGREILPPERLLSRRSSNARASIERLLPSLAGPYVKGFIDIFSSELSKQ